MGADLGDDGPKVTSFIDDIPELEEMGATVVFREFASITIFFVINKYSESELAVLDLIQFFVEVLDKYFGNNVCEIDLVFNPDKLHYILDEVILDGIVISLDVDKVLGVLMSRQEAILQQ
uniref:AP complex mu/sigma subunit domain-containing protein n=1 Tax=Strombidium rassoulzadegani TaxID=1082188 RepID=A0A7S3CRR2_9SPIT|mmetsp:Transcript_5417/g.9113  ORF Transcript_5417/g.9113 Transcript_5417/m.9113 type:complete len:120 (+) Transcript_5417:260-619(+)